MCSETKMRGILSDADIIKEKESGNIEIFPFTEKNLGNCSYDITIGENYYRVNPSLENNHVFNPWNKESVIKYWKLYIADTCNENNSEMLKLSIGRKYIMLQPLETILAHTQEFIGGKNFITTILKTRSSLARSCISVCPNTFGDISYINRWTMEITNFSKSPIILPVGSRVGQIVFFYTGIPNKLYFQNGKYQSHQNIEHLVKNWTPDSMLPKAYMDREIVEK